MRERRCIAHTNTELFLVYICCVIYCPGTVW